VQGTRFNFFVSTGFLRRSSTPNGSSKDHSDGVHSHRSVLKYFSPESQIEIATASSTPVCFVFRSCTAAVFDPPKQP